jgi:hypothetical protein
MLKRLSIAGCTPSPSSDSFTGLGPADFLANSLTAVANISVCVRLYCSLFQHFCLLSLSCPHRFRVKGLDDGQELCTRELQIQIPRASPNHHAYETSVSSTPSAAEIHDSELPNSRKEL